jgi:AcrR family transcriptional regulator
MSNPSLFAHEPAAATRILDAAHHLLLTHGYQAFTMDQLAHELGMSKKTLYVHFSSKDEIVGKIVDAIGRNLHTNLEAVLANDDLTFTGKLGGVVHAAGKTLVNINPTVLRELQRFAPAIYQKIEDIRSKVIPLVFGRLIRDGIAAGKVRRDVDPAFATEFWLHAIRGLVQPATLERTQLTLPQTFAQALDLFFAGLLTPAGRKDYEKHG